MVMDPEMQLYSQNPNSSGTNNSNTLNSEGKRKT